MLTFRAANSTLILLSAVATVLLAAFAPGPFSLGGTALAQDDPPVNFHITSYGDTWCGIEFDVPRNRGITRYDVLEYKHNGNEFVISDSIDDVPASGGSNNQWAYQRLTPDTQYKFVLRLKDDSGTTIIETSVTVRTLPTSDPDPPTPDPDPPTPDPDPPTPDPDPPTPDPDPPTPDPDPPTPDPDPPTPDPDPPTPDPDPPTPDPNVSTDATLSSLSLSGIDFSRPFSPGRYHYDASVAEDVTETTVTAMPDKPEASYKVKLNGEVKDDGVIPLSVGINVITVAVTAEDGSTSQTYTVTVTRQEAIGELPTDNPPVNFHITSYGDTWCGIEFDVPRNRGITRYDVLEYKHNGNEFVISDSIDDVPASGGSNNQWAYQRLTPDTQYKFVLRLKDDSGTTIIETSVTVRTLPTSGESTLSTDTSLSSLSLSGIDIGPFSANDRSYLATVANSVTQTTVSATANHTGASYVIWPNADGVIPLSVGRNDITITVTAEDGTSTRVYKVFVTRAGTDDPSTPDPSNPTDETPTPDPGSTDATLSSLSLSGIDFSPPFSPGRYHYDASIAEDVTETTVTATPDKPEASYKVKLNGEVKDDGFIPLSVGSSVITVAVTAEDGSTSQTYTVTVTRQEAIGELPTNNPPVNFHITSYGDTWCGIEFDVPRNRGITRYDVLEYKHNGNEFVISDSIDDVPASGGSNNQWAYQRLTPDTQYKFVLRLKDDSGTTIIETSVTVRTLPTSGESTLSTDTSLSSLSLSGIDIGPFSANDRSYLATVANSVTQTTVSATANHTGASYVIWPNADGVIPLSVGRNDITITVTAEDGTSTRVYRIFVTRDGLEEQDQPLEETSSEDQQESNNIEEKPTPTVELDGISSSHDSVRENDEQATVITLTVTLDKAAAAGGEKVTLAIVTPTKGKAAKLDEDFDATLEDTLTIAKGLIRGTAQLTLTPKDNTTADGDKAFAVQATSSSGHRALINIKITDNEIDDGMDGEIDDGENDGEDDSEEDDGEENDSEVDDGENDGENDSEEDDSEMAFGFAGEVEDQVYTAGTAITALVLPEAVGGEGEVTYHVLGLPAGLSFDATTRTISGTPTAATDGPVEVTYLAQDSAGAAAILTFFITVNPPLSFGDLFGLLNGGASDAEATNS